MSPIVGGDKQRGKLKSEEVCVCVRLWIWQRVGVCECVCPFYIYEWADVLPEGNGGERDNSDAAVMWAGKEKQRKLEVAEGCFER